MANILLAEDDASMRNFLTLALTRAGHEVLAVQDGLAALAVLSEEGRQAEGAQGTGGFDLLLTDIVMPGMDGIELSQKATRLCPQLKVMFITGFAAVAMGGHNPGRDNARVLSKPFHLRDLVDQVESLLAA